MTEDASDTATLPALDQFQRWSDLIGRGQQTMLEFMTRETAAPANPDPFGLMTTWQKVATAAAADPQKLAEMQTRFITDSLALWQSFTTPEVKPAAVADKRFKDAAWAELPAFDLMRQSYLLASKYVLETTAGLDGLSEHDKAKALFHAKQFVDALSPSNYPLTNPEVLKATIESKGENLLKGLDHMLSDLKAGRMRMTDETAFEVGRNVAVTPGKVVFENRLFQLIQYAPTTPDVYATPLLIFPPWINKFYILDLTPEKSFIRWAVEQGLTVFIVSWKNADETLADVTLDNYVGEGMVMAIAKTLEASGAERTHTIGYCVAGTTLAATLAYLTAKGQAAKIATATFFTAQVDFADCGELGVFVDDEQIEEIGKLTEAKGFLPGSAMATSFNMLRSNDLIWNYVVNNYMLGKDYLPFDLLYWNGDATNVPAKWHKAYLQDMYRDNKLIQPGGISVAGVPIDLSTVKVPAYIQGGKEDHIAPARSAYRITQALGGPVRFVLAGSGHIAGVVNPPSQHKYQYWTNDVLPTAFAAFVEGATEHKGSWWPDWIDWLTAQSGDKVPARIPGEGPLKAIEDAPGRYVKERA